MFKFSTLIAFFVAPFWVASVFANPLNCEGLFESDLSKKTLSKPGANFLLQKFNNLHNTSLVEKAVRKKNKLLQKPVDKVMAWLEYLEQTYEKMKRDSRGAEKLKTFFHKQFVIKAESIPSSYFESQIQLARERGHGNVRLTADQRNELSDILISDQKKSLDQWLDYLMSKDSESYPMWTKYWILMGMVKLSKFILETESFGNRSSDTVAPFAELNREALAYVVDAVVKKANRQSLVEIQDQIFLQLLESSNFGKLYARALKLATLAKAGHGDVDGIWKVFKQGSDHRPLVASILGKNTGWCTAGEKTAEAQLSKGDFHVYYSVDSKGEPTIPRIAIRMEGEQIGEVRGTAKDQNIDAKMADTSILSDKMKEFGERGKIYEKKSRDMKLLTEIEKKHNSHQELSVADLQFLYEINEPVAGFGYQKDPRVYEIVKARNIKNRGMEKDLVLALEGKYTEQEISVTTAEALSNKKKFHYGNLIISKFPDYKLILPEKMVGNLRLYGESSADVVLPRELVGDLDVGYLEVLGDLAFPEKVFGNFSWVQRNAFLKKVVLPKIVTKDINVNFLKSVEILVLPEEHGGSLEATQLETAGEIVFPKKSMGAIHLYNLKTAGALTFSEEVFGNFGLERLTSVEKLILPRKVSGTFVLGLESLEGVDLPEKVGNLFALPNLKSGKGLRLPREIGSDIFLPEETHNHGLIMPEIFGGNLKAARKPL